jgi:hypothetical protein
MSVTYKEQAICKEQIQEEKRDYISHIIGNNAYEIRMKKQRLKENIRIKYNT